MTSRSRLSSAVPACVKLLSLYTCGAYREFLKELAPENGKLLFLLSENRIVTLRELLPEWWGISGEKESRHSDG